MVALLVLLTLVLFVSVDLVRRRRSRQAIPIEQDLPTTPTQPTLVNLVQPLYRTPAGVFFEPGHTWLYLEESGTAKLGVDDFLRNVVGRVDEFEARSAGDQVAAGDVIVRLRHGDRSVSVRAPVDGVIEEVNTELMKEHELRGIEPFTDSWLYRLKLRDSSILAKTLLIGQEAREWLSREVQRLKVFLATIAPEHPVLGVTAQDGGVPASGLVEHLDDDEWKKLRVKFFGR